MGTSYTSCSTSRFLNAPQPDDNLTARRRGAARSDGDLHWENAELAWGRAEASIRLWGLPDPRVRIAVPWGYLPVKHHRFISSLFHRRLLLIGGLMLLGTTILSAQMVRLSVVEGSEHRQLAERPLDRRTYLPTYRGRILDRNGRVLAVDRASYDVQVPYDVITGSWVVSEAAAAARKSVGRSVWNTLGPAARQDLIRRETPAFEAEREQLFVMIRARGGIDELELTRRLDVIRGRVQRMAAVVWDRQREAEQAMYGDADDADAPGAFRPRPIREQLEAHVVLTNVSDEDAFAFRRLAHARPDLVEVADAHRREYPWDAADVLIDRRTLPRPIRSEHAAEVRVTGVADHVLGSMRDQVWSSDVERRPFRDPGTGAVDLGGYRIGDTVGARGLELVYEDHLRGARGVVDERRDTGAAVRTDPRPGEDLHLTMDVMLQARVQALLAPEYGLAQVQAWHQNSWLPEGWPLNAAAVILEVETGDVLALVTMPTIAMGEVMTPEAQRINTPVINRATEAIYPPGSIIKPMVLAAAVEEGLHRLDDEIVCDGHFFESDSFARCWIYRDRFGFMTHGPLAAAEALARSCNIFFYTLADALGPARLLDWYRRFGMGRRIEIGLHSRDPEGRSTGEHPGILPDADDLAALRAAGEDRAATIFMGIGQGPLAWTPLQAANAYARLARGGHGPDASIVLDSGATKSSATELDLAPALIDEILTGLRAAVEEHHGSGNHITYAPGDTEPIINAEQVIVWAKTGTAQAPPLRVEDTNGDGQINRDDEGRPGLDHSWFVGLVGPEDTARPMYALAVIVEYGGSGGRVAGPVANQIIHALQAEGYLPGAAR